MLTCRLPSDDVGMPMNDVGLRLLDSPAPEFVVNDYPGDRISLPVESCVILDDGEIHRDEHPGFPPELALNLTHNLWIWPARSTDASHSLCFDSTSLQSGDEIGVTDLLVEDEKCHAVPLQAQCLVCPPNRLVHISLVESIILHKSASSLVVGS